MKQSVSQKNAFQILDEFDKLENIQPSPEWEQTLLVKVDNTRRPYSNKGGGLKFAALVAFYILINAVSFRKLSGPVTSQAEKRNEVLQNISAELLINPTTSN